MNIFVNSLNTLGFKCIEQIGGTLVDFMQQALVLFLQLEIFICDVQSRQHHDGRLVRYRGPLATLLLSMFNRLDQVFGNRTGIGLIRIGLERERLPQNFDR